MDETVQPLVSIGVPVFNGENGLVCALDSLLGQDYCHLEIIISDNGSTDTTRDICEKYVRKDSRISYYRCKENFGSSRNFSRVFELSRGKYFMWAAHDDRHDPSFVRSCVDKMSQCPDAVLCQAHTAAFIEGRKEMLYTVNLDSFDETTGLVERYRETLKHFPATALYGLFLSSAMRKTKLFQNSIATDIAFAQELSILGRFVQVPKVLFTYFGRERWNTVHQDYRTFLGKSRKPFWYLPFIVLFLDHWKRVACSDIIFWKKCCLWAVLVKHEIGQTCLKILRKSCRIFCPDKNKEKIARIIYWRWMHNPNVRVGCADLYLERIIKPMLHWWDNK